MVLDVVFLLVHNVCTFLSLEFFIFTLKCNIIFYISLQFVIALLCSLLHFALISSFISLNSIVNFFAFLYSMSF